MSRALARDNNALVSSAMSSIFGRKSARIVAALLAGGLLYFTVNLTPLWPVAWVAPVPLLLASFYATSRGETRLLCAIALLLGLSSNIPYYTTVAGRFGVVLIVLLQVVQWSLIVSYTRTVVRRSRHWLTVFAYPVIWAGVDTLISTFSPHGTFGSLAYTQMDALPVVQVAVLAGGPAVVFIISLFSSCVALALYRPMPRLTPAFAYGMPAMLIVAVIAGGAWRVLRSPEPSKTMPVGMAVVDAFLRPGTPPNEAAAVWQAYDAAVVTLSKQGAKVIVLPEKIDVKEADAARRSAALAELARRTGVYLVVGIGVTTDTGWMNRAWVFGPTGELLLEYDKQHLVPGLEREMAAGNADAVLEIDGHRFGITICKDVHFAGLGRSYGRREISVMLEPAYDFVRDAWMSSRIATMRGIESGYAVVHAGRESLLSASDALGRFIVERPSGPLPGVSVIAQVPLAAGAPTPYARFGDWFGWSCFVLVVVMRLWARSTATDPARTATARNRG
jgi:apolipoprotein N-acyltransferase